MKSCLKFISLLLILSICLAFFPISVSAAPSTVSVMSYNLKNTNYSFGTVADMVKSNGADIVAMQEVNTLQYLGINAAMKNAGFDVTMGKSTGFGDNWESDEYLPIYYKSDKYKDYAHGTLWLSDTPTVQSQFPDSAYLRIVTWACYEIIGTSDYILVFNTHLDFNQDLQIRQMNVILDCIVTQTNKYFKAKNHVIFLGDLNCPNSSITCNYIQGDTTYNNNSNTYTMQKLDEARQIAAQTKPNSNGNYYTQPSDGPTMDLDHIYVSHRGFHCDSYSVISNPAGSDHLPILAKLTFKTESSHLFSYHWLSAGRHRGVCGQCGYSSDGNCSYEGDFCKLCNGSKGAKTFDLVKSMDELSSDKYLMLIQATGAYPGSFPYYAATVHPDGGFNAMESRGLAFPSPPEHITLSPEQLPSLVWQFQGDANGLVIGDASGSKLNHKGRDLYLNRDGATVWVPDYSTTEGHFALRENNRYFLSLRVDLNTIEKTGGDGPLFGCVDNTSTGTYKIFLYKLSSDPSNCSHSQTFLSGQQEVNCTQDGYSGDTLCSNCGLLLSSGIATPALGHDVYYTSRNNGIHKISCTRCKYYDTEVCIPVNGVCPLCGFVTGNGGIAEEIKDGRYVIAAKIENVYYAMSTDFAAKIPGTAIPVTDGIVSYEDSIGYGVNISAIEGGWIIYDDSGNCLKYGSSTNLGKTTTPYVWNIGEGINGTRRIYAQTEGRGLIFRAKDYMQFGGYALSNAKANSTEYYDVELIPVGSSSTPVQPNVPQPPQEPDIPVVELSSGYYVIAAKVDNSYYAMSNTFDSKIPGTPISVTNGKVPASEATELAIALNAVEGGWTIDDRYGNYLQYTGSTNLAGGSDPYVWSITSGVKGSYRIASAETSTRGIVFRAKDYMQFGGYALSNIRDSGVEYYDVELLPVDGVPETVPETLAVKIQHSLNLASDISINYAVAASSLEGYEDYYLEVVVPKYDGNTLIQKETRTLLPILSGNYYYFTLDGITAVQMNDVLDATLFAMKNGKLLSSDTDSYSISAYAYNQLGKSSTGASLLKLCAELLRYGAKAQLYKGYRTDALADRDMTATHKSYLSNLEDVLFGDTNHTLNDIGSPSVTWAGKSLILDSKVTLRMIANLGNYTGSISDLSVRVTYTNMEGQNVTVTLTDPIVYNEANQQYAFDFAELRAAELRRVLSAAVYAGNQRVSPTLEYSMDTYGNNKTGALLTLCQSLVAYSDAALEYFR